MAWPEKGGRGGGAQDRGGPSASGDDDLLSGLHPVE